MPENRATAAAISADGKFTAYANADGVFVRAGLSGDIIPLRAPENLVIDTLAWFPDNTRLAASGSSPVTDVPSVWTVFITGAPPKLLRTGARRASPSPDGLHVAFVSGDQSSISVMGASGEQPLEVVRGDSNDTFPLAFWSADGNRLSYQRRFPSNRADQFHQRNYESVDWKTGKLLARVPDILMESAVALRDGRILFLPLDVRNAYPPSRIAQVHTDPATGGFRSTPKDLTHPPGTQAVYEGVSGITATADGERAMVLKGSDQSTVFIGSLESSPPRVTNIRRLTLDARRNFPHAWTSDSSSVIFESDRNGNFDLFRQSIHQRTPESIVISQSRKILPQLTPDGGSLLYSAGPPGEEPGPNHLMRVSVFGGTPEEVPIGGTLDEFRCSLGSRGRCVLRKTTARESYIYYELDPVRGIGRELARIPWHYELLADWDISPDGQTVVIPNHDPRSAIIRVVPLNRAPEAPVESKVTLPGLSALSSVVWDRESRGWFVTLTGAIGKRMVYVFPDGRVSPVGTMQGWAVPSPDGRKIAFLDLIKTTNVWTVRLP